MIMATVCISAHGLLTRKRSGAHRFDHLARRVNACGAIASNETADRADFCTPSCAIADHSPENPAFELCKSRYGC